MDTAQILGGIWRSPALWDDLEAICECGGRFAGTQSEAKARAFLDVPIVTHGEFLTIFRRAWEQAS